MKKRILLSLVSFFAVTAMWATLTEAYQVNVQAENGKTNQTCALTLTLKAAGQYNVQSWSCNVTLPEGVTFVDAALVDGRYATNPELTTTVNEDGTITFACESTADNPVLGTDGPMVTVNVAVGDIEPGTYAILVKNANFILINGPVANHAEYSFDWAIEEGGSTYELGDVNCDGLIDIADAVTILDAMAGLEVPGIADVNGDGNIDIADFVTELDIMAAQ